MTSLEAVLRRVDADLTRSRIPFALIGGLAVSARTEPRFTRDADLAVALDSDAEAQSLVHRLRVLGYGIAHRIWSTSGSFSQPPRWRTWNSRVTPSD